MKMVCAMAMVCRRVRFVERPEAIQMTMGTLFVHIVGTSGATMETEALCLVVGLIVQSAGQWQMKHNKNSISPNWGDDKKRGHVQNTDVEKAVRRANDHRFKQNCTGS